MAAQQAKRHELGRSGERYVKANGIAKGKLTRHTAPFDVVDFNNRRAYEVKTMSALSKDLKIHIASHSWERKLDFASKYRLKMILLAVVIYSETEVEVYKSELRQSVRVNQMELIAQ